jgi:hypothetical protein
LLNQPSQQILPPDHYPACRNLDDLKRRNGGFVRVAATYEIVDISPYKTGEIAADGRVIRSSRMVILALDEGTRIRIGLRPTDEMNRLSGLRVSACGRIIVSPPREPEHVSQPNQQPTMVEVIEVIPADRQRE